MNKICDFYNKYVMIFTHIFVFCILLYIVNKVFTLVSFTLICYLIEI
jgi:hypothetical protein